MSEDRSGWVTFAGILLMVSGTLNVVYGIAGIGKSHFFNQNADYLAGNLKTWGWVSLGVGIIQVPLQQALLGATPTGKVWLASW